MMVEFILEGLVHVLRKLLGIQPCTSRVLTRAVAMSKVAITAAWQVQDVSHAFIRRHNAPALLHEPTVFLGPQVDNLEP